MEPNIPKEIPADQPVAPRFAHMNEQEIGALRDRLALKLPAARLIALATLCQKEWETLDEHTLVLLDTLLSPLAMRPHAALLAALQTHDASCARALSRLLQQSRRADGTTPQPTPESVLETLCQSQREADIYPPPPDHKTARRPTLVAKEDILRLLWLDAAPSDGQPVGDTPWQLVTTLPARPHLQTRPQPGELYSLISLPTDGDSLQALAFLLTAPDIAPKLRQLRYVTAADYAAALFYPSLGCEADFSLLTDAPTTLPDGYFICADAPTTQTLLQRTRQSGLSMTTFGRATTGDRLVITKQGITQCSLALSPLMSLCRPRAVDVRLNRQDDRRPLPAPCCAEVGSYTVLTRTIALDPHVDAQDVYLALKADISVLQGKDIVPTSLQLAVGITECQTTSLCALWSCLLALDQALEEHPIPLLPAVFSGSRDALGSVTFALIAKTAAPACPSDTVQSVSAPVEQAPKTPILPPPEQENV